MVLALILALAGCAYEPSVVADRQSAKYRADLAECQESAGKTAHHAVISRFYLFATYPVSLPIETRIATRECMTGKGYRLS